MNSVSRQNIKRKSASDFRCDKTLCVDGTFISLTEAAAILNKGA
jgi:hypothetical protein